MLTSLLKVTFIWVCSLALSFSGLFNSLNIGFQIRRYPRGSFGSGGGSIVVCFTAWISYLNDIRRPWNHIDFALSTFVRSFIFSTSANLRRGSIDSDGYFFSWRRLLLLWNIELMKVRFSPHCCFTPVACSWTEIFGSIRHVLWIVDGLQFYRWGYSLCLQNFLLFNNIFITLVFVYLLDYFVDFIEYL